MGSIKSANNAYFSRINSSWLGRTIAALGVSAAILTSSMPALAQQPITGTHERKAVQIWNPTVEGGCHHKEKLRPQALNDLAVTGITQNKIFDSGFSFVDHRDISNPYFAVSVVVNAPDKNCEKEDYNVTAKIYSRATHNTFGVIKAFNAICVYSNFENCVKDMFRQEVKSLKETPEQKSMGIDWSRGPYHDEKGGSIQDNSPKFKKFIDIIKDLAVAQREFEVNKTDDNRKKIDELTAKVMDHDKKYIPDVDLTDLDNAITSMRKHGWVYNNTRNLWSDIFKVDIGEMLRYEWTRASNWGEERKFETIAFWSLFPKMKGVKERVFFTENNIAYVNSNFLYSAAIENFKIGKSLKEENRQADELPFYELLKLNMYNLIGSSDIKKFKKEYVRNIDNVVTHHHEAVHLDPKYEEDEVKAYITEIAYSTPLSLLNTLSILSISNNYTDAYSEQSHQVLDYIARPARDEKEAECGKNKRCRKRVKETPNIDLLREKLLTLPLTSYDSSFHQYCMDAAVKAHERLYGVGK